MITETSNKNEILTAVEETTSQLAGLMSSLDETQVNTISYEDNWTGRPTIHPVLTDTLMSK